MVQVTIHAPLPMLFKCYLKIMMNFYITSSISPSVTFFVRRIDDQTVMVARLARLKLGTVATNIQFHDERIGK